MPEKSFRTRLSTAYAATRATAAELSACLALGLRDTMHPRLLLFSIVVSSVTFCFFAALFIYWGKELLTFSAIAGVVLTAGIVLMAPQLIPFTGTVAPSTVSIDVLGMIATTLFGLGVIAAMVVLVPILLFTICVLATTRFQLKLFMMDRIQQRVLRRYPDLQPGRHGSAWTRLLAELRQVLSLLLCALLCLTIPMLGAVLLLALLCYWNAYGLIRRSLDGLAGDEELRAIVKGRRGALTLLGAVLAIISFIPIIGLLGPALAGTSVAHFVMRRLAGLRAIAVDGAAASSTDAHPTMPLQVQP